ncbi:hypothetical protein [Williamwhitmania taraxaci]|uniref:Uncharacterized protein n=1 Tax=Williamwhitmania taraxaci TaxID=1640674 RepID=A0A1G6NLV0_9BACT|nr:hypothetical protein [Williamwhitmania taraxaci]SDC68631.1 hypothetical protein SAMN05216323_104414 [Williamwhitmania taraxaci]
MAKLNEYLGSIVSSITNARAMSDIQSVKVAEEYAKHYLLQHFSVPRLRIENVEITIPIALDSVVERTVTEYEPIDNRKFNALAYREVMSSIGLTSLPNEFSLQLRSEIAKLSQLMEQDIGIQRTIEPLKTFSMKVANITDKIFPKVALGIKSEVKEIDVELLKKNLEKIMAKEIKVKTTSTVIESVNVTYESDKLREKKVECLTYIKLKISEDGMEWHSMENDKGNVESRLLPE